VFKPNDPTSTAKTDVEFISIKGVSFFFICFSHVQSYLPFKHFA
jgi:hypothetical protein